MWGWQSPIFRELNGQIEMLSVYYLLCQKFLAVCQNIAPNFKPAMPWIMADIMCLEFQVGQRPQT